MDKKWDDRTPPKTRVKGVGRHNNIPMDSMPYTHKIFQHRTTS